MLHICSLPKYHIYLYENKYILVLTPQNQKVCFVHVSSNVNGINICSNGTGFPGFAV
ncbi:hypothetical protein BDC45DRAFT_498681 [Circinella umbellata]|nr:hypothetical protein BDC45DRAFT_498681 [Circinella umbellata]